MIGFILALSLVTGFSLLSPTTQAFPLDGTPPGITLGLATPGSSTGILPLPTDGTVSPTTLNKVAFRAELTDSGSGVVAGTLSVPRGASTMLCSPTAKTYLSATWDCRRAASGTNCTVKVTATDQMGNTATKSTTVCLKK